MKRLWLVVMLAATAAWAAAPVRVAVLDFEDLSGMASDPLLGGGVDRGALAAKGVNLLGAELANHPAFTLIDRRDFINQVEQLEPSDSGRPTPTKPSFIQAAQALRADAVLRGSLMSFSTGKEVVDQGGYRSEFATVSLRVSLEALDSVDGAVIAMANGVAREKFRQTQETFTSLGEDEVIRLMEKAVADALPQLKSALDKRMEQLAQRPRVKLSITTSADPALVEIDGILVGSTPLTDYSVYQGDHVLTIGKPGYFDVSKRILLEKDSAIEVPMIRVQLTADEVKDVLDKARLHVFEGEPGLIIHEINSTE